MTASSKIQSRHAFSDNIESVASVTRESEAERIEAFNHLREVVGVHKLSTQLEILQSAIDYILYLHEQLQDQRDKN